MSFFLSWELVHNLPIKFWSITHQKQSHSPANTQTQKSRRRSCAFFPKPWLVWGNQQVVCVLISPLTTRQQSSSSQFFFWFCRRPNLYSLLCRGAAIWTFPSRIQMRRTSDSVSFFSFDQGPVHKWNSYLCQSDDIAVFFYWTAENIYHSHHGLKKHTNMHIRRTKLEEN